MTLMWNIEKDAAGFVIAQKTVFIHLVGEPGYVGGSSFSLESMSETTTDANGRWELDLTPNSLISAPAGTIYLAVLRFRSTLIVHSFTAPALTGLQWIGNFLVDPPGTLPSPALSLHIANAAVHSGGSGFTHTQATAATEWVISHVLGYKPGGVLPLNGTGQNLEGDVSHPTINETRILFLTSQSGTAILS